MKNQHGSLNTKPLKATHSSDEKRKFLGKTIQHIDVTKQPGIVPLVESMQHMAYSSRDLWRAADIYDRMLRDQSCGVILTLAGSLISAGLKKVFVDMVRNNMVDAIVSTGANMVDQDFFEALGFKHYIAEDYLKAGMNDGELREHAIDRIYDTLIDEEELRVCDETTQLKIKNAETGLFMIGGGVPKNFTQDIVVCAETLGHDAPMHKYAIQVTVADVRDGALSSSTLKEASSWGKVDTVYEQMVFSEATLAVPMIVGYAYHKRGWEQRSHRRFADIYTAQTATV